MAVGALGALGGFGGMGGLGGAAGMSALGGAVAAPAAAAVAMGSASGIANSPGVQVSISAAGRAALAADPISFAGTNALGNVMVTNQSTASSVATANPKNLELSLELLLALLQGDASSTGTAPALYSAASAIQAYAAMTALA